VQGVVYALLAAKAHTKIESRSEGTCNNDHFLHFFFFHCEFIANVYRVCSILYILFLENNCKCSSRLSINQPPMIYVSCFLSSAVNTLLFLSTVPSTEHKPLSFFRRFQYLQSSTKQRTSAKHPQHQQLFQRHQPPYQTYLKGTH
jgi:hypothetical protein